MGNKRVSILVPVYKVERFIAQCAHSLFGQDYENIQFVFVDDCTPDKSVEVLKEVAAQYPNRTKDVVILHHERNKGLSAARNTALDVADGEYVMPMDSDDYLSSNSAVTKIMIFAEKNDADSVIFDIQDVFENKRITHSQQIPVDSKEYVKKLLSREVSLCLCGGVYKRDLFVKYGIKSIEGIGMGEDYAVKPRLMYNANRIIHLPEPFYCYTHISQNSYTKKYSSKYLVDLQKALDVLTYFFSTIPDSDYFLPSLHIAYMKVKAGLGIAWGLLGKDIIDFQAIVSFQSPYGNSENGLSFSDRISIFLQKHELPYLMKLYAKIGMKIKSLLK